MVTDPHPLSLLDRMEMFFGFVLVAVVFFAGIWARWQKEKSDWK